MKFRTQSLIALLIFSLAFISCDVSEVADELAKAEETLEEEGDEEGYDEEEELVFPEETEQALAALANEDITEFILCVEGVGEVDMFSEDTQSLIGEDEEEELVEVAADACGGNYSMIINGQELEGDFIFEADSETTTEDVLEGIFDCVENGDEEEGDEESDDDENEEYDDENEDEEEEE